MGMNLLIISGFPSKAKPWTNPFVKELVRHLIPKLKSVTVVSPQAFVPYRPKLPYKAVQSLSGVTKDSTVEVLRPRYPAVPIGRVGSRFRAIATQRAHAHTTLQCIKREDLEFDVVYSHFLFRSGYSAIAVGRRLGIPVIIGCGESDMRKHERPYGITRMRRIAGSADHLIPVSNSILRYLTDTLSVPKEKVTVLPNGVDPELFYPRDKERARANLGLPKDQFIPIFVGHFNERKGVGRLVAALKSMSPTPKAIFLGTGAFPPPDEVVLFSGTVSHDNVPHYLSAADVFVLPTRAEGCCNAVLEAQACGLPVISSAIPGVEEHVPADVGILTPPDAVPEIAQAIRDLRDNLSLRAEMGLSAQRHAQHYNVTGRAERVASILMRAGGEPEAVAGVGP
ncbi:MAG: glycosyltransferase family 4 protein [Gemmatimonadales bacterium]|nr:MAG: glycosyltransferase family 4 protein [Gemmatimonadales bacterium]